MMSTPRRSFVRESDASTAYLPAEAGTTVLDGLCAKFPHVSREQWRERLARGRVLDEHGVAIGVPTLLPAGGLHLHYYREVVDEAPIPFSETIVYIDEHLVVADKPHFLPVIPSGGFVEQTLLRRLVRRLDNPDLVPLHRIDRGTAGLVMFSANRSTRSIYQALFQQRAIEKRYEALAPPLPGLAFPRRHGSRLAAAEPFFRMQEVAGEPNTETRIDVLSRVGRYWHYALYPVTGKKHQLRVHMAALGAPIMGDCWYPVLRQTQIDDYREPLQLLAQSLAFFDPISGEPRTFASLRQLQLTQADDGNGAASGPQW